MVTIVIIIIAYIVIKATMNSILNRVSGPSKQMNSSLPSYDLQRLFHNIHTTPTTKVSILTPYPSPHPTFTLTNHLF